MPGAAGSPSSVLTFDIAGKPVSFESPVALLAFARGIHERWQWLSSSTMEPLRQEWSIMRNGAMEVERFAGALQTDLTPQQRAEFTSKIQSLLNQLQACRFLNVMTEARTARALQLMEESKAADASHMVNAWLSLPGQSPGDIAIRGVVLAALFDEGLHGRRSAEQKALEDASKWWSDFQAEARSQMANVRATVEKFEQETRKEREGQFTTFATLTSESKTRLHELEQTFKEKLALQAPVSYWTKKADEHRQQSKLWGVRFGILLVFSAVVFAFELSEFWDLGMDASATSGGVAAIPKALAAWQTVFLVTTATLLFWPLRIVARLLLANVHLRLDAQERATMANTYLSLSAEGKEMPIEDRHLILAALFRPTATGVVRDEGVPPSALEALSKMATGR